MNRFAVLLVLGIFLVAGFGIASADSLMIEDIAQDTWVESADPDFTGNDDSTFLGVEMDTDSNDLKKSYIEFNINESFFEGYEIDSATLRLYMHQAPNVNRSHELYLVASSWIDTNTSWNNQPIIGDLVDVQNTGIVDGVWVEFDVTSVIQGFLDGDFENYGFMVQDSEGINGSDSSTRYRASGWEDPSVEPEIFVEYSEADVPDPLSVEFTGDTPEDNSVQAESNFMVELLSSDGVGGHFSFLDFNSDLLMRLGFDSINESGDPQDMSSYNHDAVALGDSVVTNSGRFGDAFQFDGDGDYVSIPSIDLNNKSYSISAWVKQDTNNSVQTFFGAHSAAANSQSLHLRILSNGAVLWGLWFDDLSTPAGTMNLGEWNHLTFVYNAVEDMSYIYHDGVEVVSGTNGPFLGDNPEMAIGRWRSSPPQDTQYFDGSVDEFMIFERALTEGEVGSLFDASVTQYGNDFSELEDSFYSFTGYAVDLEGSFESTGLRNVEVDSSYNDTDDNNTDVINVEDLLALLAYWGCPDTSNASNCTGHEEYDFDIDGDIDDVDLYLLLSLWGLPHQNFSLASADLNLDGFVDVSDLLLLLGNWGPCSEGVECVGDIFVDGMVDEVDLELLLKAWHNLDVELTEPFGTYSSETGLPLSFTINDDGNFTCSYQILSGSSVVVNETELPDCLGTTFDLSEGSYTFRLFVDMMIGSSSRTYVYNSDFEVDVPETVVENNNNDGTSSGGGGGGSSSSSNNRFLTLSDILTCTTEWVCEEEWSECVDGVQTRSCDKPEGQEECFAGLRPETTRVCESSSLFGNGGFFSFITGAVIGEDGTPNTVAILAFIVLLVLAYFIVGSVRSSGSEAAAGSEKKNGNGKKAVEKKVEKPESS